MNKNMKTEFDMEEERLTLWEWICEYWRVISVITGVVIMLATMLIVAIFNIESIWSMYCIVIGFILLVLPMK